MDGVTTFFLLWMVFEIITYLVYFGNKKHFKIRIFTGPELDEFRTHIKEHHEDIWQEFLQESHMDGFNHSPSNDKLLSDFIIKNDIEHDLINVYNSKHEKERKPMVITAITILAGAFAYATWKLLW